mgnify:CR=1 FL=1
MNLVMTLGRILFVMLFIVSGIMKLTDIAATAQLIAAKLIIPASLAPYVTQVEAATGMPVATLLAIAAGIVEVLCAVMIAFGLAGRTFAVILLLYVLAATALMHDFWNLAGAERINDMIQALKNLSLVGGLMILVASAPREAYEDRRVASYDGH